MWMIKRSSTFDVSFCKSFGCKLLNVKFSLECVWMREFKILRISNTSIEILIFLKCCVWIKKIKIVRVKENECKEKTRYA